tara:strand:+ start:51 stop:1358 length:1308 start_codon:yes stop_codon:yes gene_type:complete
MAINPTHVVMGRNIAASGSLAGEMKVAAISGSTGLTLNQMLIKLDDNATADVAALKGDAAGSYDTLGKIEDIVIANDAAVVARLNVIEGSGNGSITKAVADLVDSAPGALDTLNELAAAMGDDANFGTTVTNSIAAVQADVNANEVVSDAVIGVSGGSHLGTFSGGTIADDRSVKVALQEVETALEAISPALRGDAASAYNTLGKIEDVIIANDAALRGDSATAYNTLGKIEDFIIALQADVDANELASDNAESTLTTNLSALSGGLDGRLDVLEAGAGSAGSVAKAQADAQAFATAAIADLVDSAPGALNTLNELAAALNDDASLHTTITNMVAANEVHIDNFATLSGVAKDAVNFGTFTGQSIQDNRVLKVALQDLETAIEGNETEENTRLDKAGGFHVENSAGVYKLGWGSGKPRVSFSISGSDVTMSVDVE